MTDQPTVPIPPPKRRFRDRSTSDLLVLMIAATICGTVIFTSVCIIIIEFLNPEVDTAGPLRAVADVINTLIGLLAGFLAGRTDATMQVIKDREAMEADARERYKTQEPPA